MRRIVGPVWLTVALTAAACGVAPDTATVTVHDSAGIRVVVSHGPAWEPETAWRLSAEPSLSIGAQEGGAAYLFHGIVGAKRLSDGRIAVADYASHQIRYFDATGRFLMSVGREGDGPGEFRFMSQFWRLPGDTLVVTDRHGLNLFDASGTWVSTVRLQPTASGFTAGALGMLDDGLILAMNGTRSISPADAGALIHNTLEIHAFDRDGSWRFQLDTAAAAPLWFIEGTTDLRRAPFRPYPTRTTTGTRVWLASGAEPEIELRRADGTLERIVRWTPPARALTDDHIARYREYLLESTSNPDTRRRHVQFMDEVPMPEELPALGDAPMHVDTKGHLWAEAYRPPWDAEPEWLVFSPEGEWLGSVRTPVGFVLRDIGADFVLGSWRDDLGVEYVHIYELLER